MRRQILIVVMASVMASAAAFAQTVAIVNGKPVTAAQVEALKASLPPELAMMVGRDPDELLRYYGYMSRMAELAEKEGLGERSPYKEQLDLHRKDVLGRAMMAEYRKSDPATEEELTSYYDRHKDAFTLAEVEAFCVPVRGPEDVAAATAKADKLRRQLEAGGGSAALAKEYPVPAIPDWAGELSPMAKSDTRFPEVLREAVFAVKARGVTKPVALRHGVYVLHVKQSGLKPLSEVRGQAVQAVMDERLQTWMAAVRQSVTVEKPGAAK
jgi:peptidyl-prolyl cis-trans isomerase C